MSKNQELVQSYNPQSKKWTLIDRSKKGGIIDNSPTPFQGVEVVNEKVQNGNLEHTNKKTEDERQRKSVSEEKNREKSENESENNDVAEPKDDWIY